MHMSSHYSINYIEANSVHAGYVETPEEWPWSLAGARMKRTGLVPDDYYVPVLIK